MATHAVPNFLGGEISQFAQGRFDDPKYRVSLNVCLNSFPVEIGPHVRRPGTAHAMTTRSGKPGRVIRFDFEQSSPYTIELTDGIARFRSGLSLATTNDAQSVLAISSANPAVVQVAAAWATGTTVMFLNAASNCPLLLDRQFTITHVDSSHMSLQDAVTGANIDGSTLGTIGGGMTVARVQELATVYTAGSWASVRAVQAETTDVLLHGSFPPQLLTVASLPTAAASAVFAINPATFIDGPYLDPFTNGVQAVPSALLGAVTITLQFPPWSASVAYEAETYITSSGVNYLCIASNINQTPASNPTFWTATSGSSAIQPNGFQATDIGRSVRFFSEPAAWLIGTTYAVKATVSYNPSGVPGATTYWQSLTSSNTGNAPGSDLTNWQIIPQGAAIWTWGTIASLSNIVARNPAGSANIGTMTIEGGLAAAFNGVFSQPTASSALFGVSSSGVTIRAGQQTTPISGYVGKNFTGSGAQVIQQATIYPTNDNGMAFGSYFATGPSLNIPFSGVPLVLNLRAKQTAPSSSSDGTLLATSSGGNAVAPVTLVSNDQTTTWNYVWIEFIAGASTFFYDATSFNFNVATAQISFFNPPSSSSSGASAVVNILGPPLLYSQPILTWRIGVYSGTTGYPTCGGYSDDGRIWLGGAVANRFDTCVSNGISINSGATISFAPTDQFGVVSDNNAISYVLNSDGTNPILWFEPDAQGMLMGTQAGEWLATAPTAGPITPTNIAARRVTKIGGAFVEPRRTEHTLVFVQRYGRKLVEDFPDVFSGKFSAPNIAEKAQKITSPGIVELGYCSAAAPIIWGRTADNALFGVTYKRDTLTTSQGPTFAAWHRHTLGSGRVVESICAGPSVDGDLDAITMVTNDPATNIRHVEVLTDTPDETTVLADCWYLDNAITPASTVSSTTPITGAPYGGLTINGLWHLNGATVQVFAGGLDCGDVGDNKTIFSDFTVVNGSIFVPYGDGVSAGSGAGLFTAAFVATNPPIVVGFTYNSDGQLVRPIADTGARSGPAALGLQRDLHRYALLVSNSRGISIGTSFSSLDPVNFNQDGASLQPLDTFSGIAQGQLVGNGDYDGMLCWRASRPNSPANIVALAINLEAKDQ